MNAILVFDPSNDLVFSKSNKLFGSRVLRYSKLQGLIAGSGPLLTSATSSSSTSSNSTSSTSTSASSTSASPCAELSTGSSGAAARRRRRCRRRGGPRQGGSCSLNDEHLLNAANGQLDCNKKYLEILMLLLTPYVASLRLSGLIKQQQQAALQSLAPATVPSNASAAGSSGSHSGRKSSNSSSDLLSKFMSSIQVNHEGRIDDASFNVDDVEGLPEEEGEEETTTRHEFTPRRFSQFQMPVECLSDCQIVYCELFDFIFIHMQQLEQVSSFKMRLLQKRIDLFARLALLLFGPSLSSMRNSQQHQQPQQQQQVDQGRILRMAYDVWMGHQFDPEFLLEANERLMVGKPIEQHCHETLRKLSIHLRRCSSHRETHMHSLLYSGTKLTYNIHHNNEVETANDDDYDGDQVANDTNHYHHYHRRSGKAAVPTMTPAYCYSSNFNTNRRTSEIHQASTTSSSPPSVASSMPMGVNNAPPVDSKSGMRRRQRRRRYGHRPSPLTTRWPSGACGGRAGRSPSESQMSSSTGAGGSRTTATTSPRSRQLAPAGDDKLPSQFLIFLSTPGKFKDRLRVPHMLRLVPLARGVTLIIISEISTSYLSLQLNRVLKILLELTNPVAAATGPPPPPAITKTPAGSSLSSPKFQPQPNCCQVKLSQLAKINDCVCAIKSYFNGQNYDLIDHHQHSVVVGGQPLVDSALNSSSTASSRLELSRGEAMESASVGDGGGGGGRQQQQQQQRRRRQSNLVNLFSRWYSGGSNKSPASDQTKTTKQTESSEPDFGLNLGAAGQCGRGSGEQPVAAATAKTVYESLDERARRQCCQLVCRLEDLVSNNMHTYMRRTFNLQVEERKRQALLNSVALVLRGSLDTFIFQPQMRLLNDRRGPYLRLYAELMDQVRLLAGEHLSDYLDYLALKGTCNVTLGAPITHDMLAIRSFIYVDRGRQEMLVSPMSRSSSKMHRDAMLEVDFRSAISNATSHSHDLPNNLADSSDTTEGVHSSPSSSLDEDEEEDADESCSSSGRSVQSVIYRPTSSSTNNTTDHPIQPQGKPVQTAKQQLGRRVQSEWLIGTSGDLVTANELGGSSSGQSLDNSNTSSSQNNNSHRRSLRSSAEDYLELARASSSPEAHLVDETLMKGFTCFIYNRLAKGKTSFTSNDVAEPGARRKLEVSRRLEANYNSMPSVVCDDFFGSYARSLFGNQSNSTNKSRTTKKQGRHKQVEVACKISELDPSSGQRLVRRRLSQLKDMDEEEEEGDDDEDSDFYKSQDDSSRDSSENDFGLFLRNQAASTAPTSGGGRPRFTIERVIGGGKRQNCANRDGAKVEVKRAGASQNGAQCYELFCVHQASLLVHRRQVLVEAERLARRLGQLCAGDDGGGGGGGPGDDGD